MERTINAQTQSGQDLGTFTVDIPQAVMDSASTDPRQLTYWLRTDESAIAAATAAIGGTPTWFFVTRTFVTGKTDTLACTVPGITGKPATSKPAAGKPTTPAAPPAPVIRKRDDVLAERARKLADALDMDYDAAYAQVLARFESAQAAHVESVSVYQDAMAQTDMLAQEVADLQARLAQAQALLTDAQAFVAPVLAMRQAFVAQWGTV